MTTYYCLAYRPGNSGWMTYVTRTIEVSDDHQYLHHCGASDDQPDLMAIQKAFEQEMKEDFQPEFNPEHDWCNIIDEIRVGDDAADEFENMYGKW